jgi:hypothetical protein
MRQIDFLSHALSALERIGIRYAVVGSYASTAWGEPRMTRDIDIVVEIGASEVNALCDAFPDQDYYVSRAAANDAIRGRGQFNVIHPASGNKIDFMVAGDGDWFKAQLKRRERIEFSPAVFGYVAAPEDVVLGKLLYFREGRSEKHLRDIRGILKVTCKTFDYDYTRQRSIELGVKDEWDLLASE